MRRLIYISVSCLLFFAISLTGYSQIAEVENFFVNNTKALAVDSGYLWAGTQNHGIVVRTFNGTVSKTYNKTDGLLCDEINTVIVDHENKKWIGTAQGLNVFDNNQWVSLTQADGLVGNDVKSLHNTGADSLWIGTTKGLSFFDGNTFYNYTTSDGLISNVINDLSYFNGKLYVATIMGVMIYDGDEFQLLDDPQGLSDGWVNTITVSSQGTLWFGTNAGAAKYEGDSWEYFDTENGLLSNEIQDILSGKEKTWILTNGGGVAVYQDGVLRNFTKDNSNLPVNNFKTLAEDKEQNIWVGYYKGISKYHNEEWVNFSEVTDNHINSSISDCENLWLATDNGLTKHNSNNWNTYTIYDGLISNHSHDIVADDKDIWVATDKGVTKFNESRAISYTTIDGLIANNVNCVAKDSSNNKWFGTNEGVSVFDGHEWKNYTREKGLAGNQINDIQVAQDGTVWIATYSGVSSYQDDVFENYKISGGLVSDSVNTLFVDEDSTVWFGTTKGLSLFDGSTWETIDSADGLIHPNITSVVQKDSNMWIGTDQGIAIYDRQNWSFINQEQGMLNAHINDLTVCSQFVWANTNEGLSRIDYFINYAPTDIEMETSNIPENIAAGKAITSLDARDPNENDSFTFSLLNDPSTDNDLFEIQGYELITKEAIDFEMQNEYSLLIKAEDQYGGSLTQKMNLNINDLSPILNDNQFSILENPLPNEMVGNLNLSARGDTNSVIFEILSGNIDSAFHIDRNTGLIWVNNPEAIDYESVNEFMLTVVVSDGNNSDTAHVKIEVVDKILEGYNLLFVITNEDGHYLENARVTLEGYRTLTTLSNGQVVFGNVLPATNLRYLVEASGFKSDTSYIDIVDENVTEVVSLTREESQNQPSDTTLTGINSITADQINVYPNPASNYIAFDSESLENTTLLIRKVNGVLVKQIKISDQARYDVSFLSPGIYFFEFIFESSSVYKKIIIR